MKEVIPRAKMLMTVPETIWFVLYLIDSQPWNRPKAPPAISAPTSPAIEFWAMLPISEPIIAPISIMPSMAMLTTPARSQSTPESAARVIGTALSSDELSSPPRLVDVPAAAQTRNPNTKKPATSPNARFVMRPKPRTSSTAPRKMQTSARMRSDGRVETTQSGRVVATPPGVKPKVVVWPASMPAPKPNHKTRPSTTNSDPNTNWRVRGTAMARDEAAVAVIDQPPQPRTSTSSPASAGWRSR